MKESEPIHGIVISKNVSVLTRDGIGLATDIYRPATGGEPIRGQFPTILLRTSYDKTTQRHVEIADFFTPRGYVVVLQDFRGRFQSEGTGQYFHTANAHEGQDGYDTVEWIAGQPWSNGRIGMVGSSHAAVAQVHLALYRPPHLSALWPDVTPINSFAHQARRGGAMQLQMFGALFVHALEASEIRENPAAIDSILDAMQHMRELVYATPFKPGHTPLSVVPNLERTLFDYYYRGSYDEYWAAEYNDFQRHFDRHADVPLTLTGGWYDLFADATCDYYRDMIRRNSSQVRLIMGPWNHTGMRGNLSWAGDVDFGPESVWGKERYFREQLRWFDRWLKGMENDIEKDTPVRIFVMGGGDGTRTRDGKLNHGGRWRSENEWPLARALPTNFYFRSNGLLSLESPTESEPSSTFTFDPTNPVPTIGAAMSGLMEIVPLHERLDPYWAKSLSPWVKMRSIVQEGPAHQKEEAGIVGAKAPFLPLATRPDVLVFQTAPLSKDVEVTGPIEVVLWVSSSAVDTDFTAKLIDVHPPNNDYPSGYHMNLTDSVMRVRYRDTWDEPRFMKQGEIYEVKIAVPPVSNLFKVGHRIRVDISSSNFPRFDVNPNSGEPMGRHTTVIVARNTVHHDSNHASHIILPIVPQ